ncbi:MAG: thioredoxin family protein [Pirellulales bacterium]|nr:thioredoxin family protein [Pirellulales bacterium]
MTATDPAKIGSKTLCQADPVEDFTLQDFRGKQVSLSDFADQQLVVLAFMGTECPLARLYAPRLQELSQQYAEKGVVFLAIDANSHDSLTEIGAFVHEYGLKIPFLKDVGNVVADAVAAERTPEVFLLDQQRVVRYRGRIDDQYGIGYIRDEPETRNLAEAIDSLLAGEPVATPKTDAVGCLIGRVRKPDENTNVTYSNQIARILQDNCVECHRSGQIGPFALTEYDEVAGWSGMIAEVVAEQRMPPWHATEDSLTFGNERRLTQVEKQLIYDWVAAGAPQGDPDVLPKPMEFIEGWNLPEEPDDIVHMSEQPFTVPAEGAVEYQYFFTDGWEEDRWFKAVEVRPTNTAVVHHVAVFARVPGQFDRRNGGFGSFLATYVPGLRAQPFPQGMAKRIPAGSELVFQVHYTPIGTEQPDRSMAGFVWADPKEITHEVTTVTTSAGNLRIPPHANDYKTEATSHTLPKDALLLGMMPHMHLRGKSAFYELHWGENETKNLLSVPRYDFNWQTFYRVAEPLSLPAGSRVSLR